MLNYTHAYVELDQVMPTINYMKEHVEPDQATSTANQSDEGANTSYLAQVQEDI